MLDAGGYQGKGVIGLAVALLIHIKAPAQKVLTFAQAEKAGLATLRLEAQYPDKADSLQTLSDGLGPQIRHRLLAQGYRFPRKVQVFGRLFIKADGHPAYLLFTPMCNLDGWQMPPAEQSRLATRLRRIAKTGLALPISHKPYSLPFILSEGKHPIP